MFFPIFVFFTIWVNAFFIIYKGTPGVSLKDISVEVGIGYAAAIGAGVAVLFQLFAMPWIKKRVHILVDNHNASELENGSKLAETEFGVGEDVEAKPAERAKEKSVFSKFGLANLEKDAHVSVSTDAKVASVHDNAEVFPIEVEKTFTFLQVATACFSAWAHGSNDVANSVAPFAAIIYIYENGTFSNNADVPIWILAMGGGGIVIGLATYGYNVITTIGVKLTKITPSRGFAIELTSALVVVVASRLELPVSTTHCQVGATMGVGILDGKSGVNWKLFGKIALSWVATVAFAGLVSAGFFAFAVFSPSAPGFAGQP